MFNIKFADLNICINYEDETIEKFFFGYETQEKADFDVSISENDIDYERNKSEYNPSRNECIRLAIYRKISETLPNYDAFLIHGSALYIDDEATILMGESGAGKSTHARLLREHYNAKMINDDKPLIRFIDGIPYIYGTPYDGKHRLSQNISKPLKNIIFINKDTNNSIKLINKNDSFTKVFLGVYRPKAKESVIKTINLVNSLINYTNQYDLYCDISKQAADTSYEIIK